MPDPLVLRFGSERDDWLDDEVAGFPRRNPVLKPEQMTILPSLAQDPRWKWVMARFERELDAARPREAYLKKKIKAGKSTLAERREKLVLDRQHTAILDRRERALRQALPGEITESVVLPYAGMQMSLLSQTSKMACYSYGHSAMYTCPGAEKSARLCTSRHLGICWQCYATKGNFDHYRVVKALSYERMLFSQNHEDFVDTMVEAIRNPRKYGGSPKEWTDPGFFRIHDSGDVYSADYADRWLQIIDRCKEILFWMPTRVWAVTDERPDLIDAVRRIAELGNVVVRPSSLGFDDMPPNSPGGAQVPGLMAGSTAVFVKEPKGWNLQTSGTMARRLTGQDKASFGVVKPNWDPNIRKKMEARGVFFCPAADYEEPEFNCTTMPGPDGLKPCRVCWGVTSQRQRVGLFRGQKTEYSMIPVAYKWH